MYFPNNAGILHNKLHLAAFLFNTKILFSKVMSISTRENDNDPTVVRGNAVDVKSTTNQLDAYGQKVMQV